ncbi:hypothetical protein [Gluconobacter cerinus]|uniref:hypothetical protein n=1 Tax=Gluconobacter cerinus TaxID=38307 RepID=UPI001B8AE071|nr:hypothetical protein [Gluconobacter cerinus]MBS1026146.1 hypothetical protein [Gluconobacter cerinus]MBS1044581.1 hypothetical protein [Gluconobacter cerinus]
MRKEWIGKKFGLLTIEALLPNRMAACRCDCGGETRVFLSNLPRGNTQTCGCIRRKIAASKITTHGRSSTPEYRAWSLMRNRCHNPKARDYSNYGGRGIFVATEWRDSFELFFRDMGERPSRGYSLGRIDNDGPYAPHNCRWETPDQQAQNRRQRNTSGTVYPKRNKRREDLIGTRSIPEAIAA